MASLIQHSESGKRHFPQPRGPHSVGYMDLMTPGDPRSGSLLRIYYPTSEQCLEGHERWPVWAEDKYISGLLTFMQAMMHRWPSWASRSEYLYLDSLKHVAPFIPQLGFVPLFRLLVGQVYVPIIRNAEPLKHKPWPLIIFSHGLGCARFTYSQICYDLASYGFVVAAPEHRDGSGCMSFFSDQCIKHWLPHRRVHHSEDEYSVRNEQLHHRADEVGRALRLMELINQGQFVENVLPAVQNQAEVNLQLLRDTMDLSKVVMCGHSFGGATTLLAMKQQPRFRLGISLDGWMFPLRDETFSVQQPVMFINMESFLLQDNLNKMASLSSEAAHRQCLYIQGSVHQNHLDVPFVFSHLPTLQKMLGMHSPTCPEIVMHLTSKLTVQFIRKHLDCAPDPELDADIDQWSALLKQGFLMEQPQPQPQPPPATTGP